MKVKLLLVIAVVSLLAGCETAYPTGSNSESPYPAISDVPPSFYNNNPALRHWYTYPYWDPSVGP